MTNSNIIPDSRAPGQCTGTISDYDVLSGRGIIRPNDGAGDVEFLKNDVLGAADQVPVPGTPVRYHMRVGSLGISEARFVRVIDESDPCPCGSQRPYRDCHAPKQEDRSNRPIHVTR